jgi:hypothetical protein
MFKAITQDGRHATLRTYAQACQWLDNHQPSGDYRGFRLRIEGKQRIVTHAAYACGSERQQLGVSVV